MCVRTFACLCRASSGELLKWRFDASVIRLSRRSDGLVRIPLSICHNRGKQYGVRYRRKLYKRDQVNVEVQSKAYNVNFNCSLRRRRLQVQFPMGGRGICID
jgi:hypothetical protein